MNRQLLEHVSKFCGARSHDDAAPLVIAAK